MQIPSVHDSSMAPPGKHATGDRQDQQVRPNFEDIQIRHITFAPYHMNTMFGAPAGDFCHVLLHPDLMGPNRPGPKGFRDLPIGIDGLYLGGAGCHGGPGITFIPGYNAGYHVLDDLG